MNTDQSFSIDDQPCILVTGGTGFAGSHLVELLNQSGLFNIHVTSFSSAPSFISQLLPPTNIHAVDLTNLSEVQKLIAQVKPNQIYHLASAAGVGSSFEQTQQILESHLKLQLNLLETVKDQCPSCRILSIGSALEYQPSIQPLKESDPLGPVSPYAVSKIIQDMLSHSYAVSYGMDIVQVRPFNHIGERQALGFAVPDFAKQIIEVERGLKSEISVGNLSSIRDFSDVKDTVAAYKLLMENGVSGEVYNVGSGIGYSIQQILDWLVGLANTPIKVNTDTNKHRPLDQAKVIADNSKLRALGWAPKIEIQDTLSRIINWWRSTT